MKNKKNIIVVSHPRSGTHFLITSILDGLNGVQRPGGREHLNMPTMEGEYKKGIRYKKTELLKNYRKKINDYLNTCPTSSKPLIIKSHHDIRFFDDWVFDKFNVVYIHRCPLDTLTSLYHYYHHEDTKHAEFPRGKSVQEFLFEVPSLEWATYSYTYKNYNNNVETLKDHHKEWLQNKCINLNVKYEELKHSYMETLNTISEFLGLTISNYNQPGLTGVCKRKGITGDYVNLLSEDQIQRINSLWQEKKSG